MNTGTNGQSTTDTSREEGRQEGSKGLCLQQSSCKTIESEGHQLIIHIENARDKKIFIAHNIQTTEEVREKIFLRYPEMNHEKLEFRFFTARMGSTDRKQIQGPLPSIEELWVTLYLRKH
jgi:hypothetical protein